MRTVTRLFSDHRRALAAVDRLEAQGFASDDISLVSNNAEGWHPEGAGRRDATRRDHDHDHDDGGDVAGAAVAGAGIGGAVGAGAGLLAGLGLLAIPGIGPVVAAGWLASTAIGAVGGAAVGGATGGLVGALTDSGESEEDAHVYAEGVRRGGALVSVRTSDERLGEAAGILAGAGGVHARDRGEAYRAQGWRRYDPDAAPYSGEQMRREREASGPGEARSFAGRDDADGGPLETRTGGSSAAGETRRPGERPRP